VTSLQGARVLVTGADGFIGSHLTERLAREGADVRALCIYTSDGRRGWLEDAPVDLVESLDIRLGDVRDEGFVRTVVDGVDVVLHLAALIAIPYSYIAPASFVETNVRGTLNVLDACRSTGARLVHTSTSEVYGTPRTVPITETHPLQGQSPYSASKIAADKMAEAYACSFEVPVTVLRPFNTFGPRQSARAVIPTILAQLLAGQVEVDLGSLEPRRDFTFVDDTVDGFVKMAATELPPGTVVQLGSGSAVSIGELFGLCCEITGQEARPTTDPARIRPPNSEVDELLSDPTRAAELLGWKPTTSLREGLSATAAWLEGRVDARRARHYQR
jgi:UDP-glucose 4-epimerase